MMNLFSVLFQLLHQYYRFFKWSFTIFGVSRFQSLITVQQMHVTMLLSYDQPQYRIKSCSILSSLYYIPIPTSFCEFVIWSSYRPSCGFIVIQHIKASDSQAIAARAQFSTHRQKTFRLFAILLCAISSI